MILTLHNITKTFTSPDKREIEIFSNLNLEIPKGETVAILGQSGCGKSTLLSLIAGLENPDQGTVQINGTHISGLKEAALTKFRAQSIGIIFQQFHLMPHLNALENVSLPLELAGDKAAREKAMAFIEKVGLKERHTHFPRQLSGGENQRVAIARALVSQPQILLADEPTGSLDEATGERLADILFELVDAIGMTLVLVTHSKSLAARCRKQLTLKDGVLHHDTV